MHYRPTSGRVVCRRHRLSILCAIRRWLSFDSRQKAVLQSTNKTRQSPMLIIYHPSILFSVVLGYFFLVYPFSALSSLGVLLLFSSHARTSSIVFFPIYPTFPDLLRELCPCLYTTYIVNIIKPERIMAF